MPPPSSTVPIFSPQSAEILTAQDSTGATQNRDTRVFVNFLRRATPVPETHSPSAAVDFLWHLFKSELEYESGESKSMIATGRSFQFIMCGRAIHVKTDFHLAHLSTDCIQLLVQEDKRRWLATQSDPECQPIAEAIAAFIENNSVRVRTLGPPQGEETLIGFTMTGTVPIFYKIPVTTALVHAIEGRYPPQETLVYAHQPEIPRPHEWYTEGMVPLDNRYIILSCFEALRRFIR